MAETNAYRKWLATGYTRRGVIDTIQVSHPKWGDLYLANWDSDIDCTLDDVAGDPVVTFNASRFQLQKAQVTGGTDQTTTITINSFDGLLYGELKAMTPAERVNSPITITPRMYWTNNQTAGMINPPPVWTLHNATVSMEAVTGEIKALPMRTQRVGIYYDALEFPALRFYA